MFDLTLQIADFGLSNLYRQGEFLQTFCGSPLYASPEIVNGKPYTGPEVSLYSPPTACLGTPCGSRSPERGGLAFQLLPSFQSPKLSPLPFSDLPGPHKSSKTGTRTYVS